MILLTSLTLISSKYFGQDLNKLYACVAVHKSQTKNEYTLHRTKTAYSQGMVLHHYPQQMAAHGNGTQFPPC